MALYTGDHDDYYPYCARVPPGAFWWPVPDGSPAPQELLFPYVNSVPVFVCPQDPSPDDFVWWEFDYHPSFTGPDNLSSYMFSEEALYGVARSTGAGLRSVRILEPTTFGYTADGWESPNGWNWHTVDPSDPAHRIDWSHLGFVNFLWGDLHVASRRQVGAGANIRSNPLNLDPAD